MNAAAHSKADERSRISFRAEFYNLFNNVNFGLPDSLLTSQETLGKIGSALAGSPGAPLGSSAGGSRVAQLALRYDF